MDVGEMETLLRSLDQRVGRVEQILPTLATRDEMKAAIADAVAPLATKAELAAAIAPLATKGELAAAIAPLATKAELAAAIAPLATKAELAATIAPLATKSELAAAIASLATKAELTALRVELRGEIRDDGERTRRHFDVVAESLRDDIRIVAESVIRLGERVERLERRP